MIIAYFQLLIKRMENVDEHSISGNLPAWYRSLKTFWRDIRDIIYFKTYKGNEENKTEEDQKPKKTFEDIDKEIQDEFEKILTKLTSNYPLKDSVSRTYASLQTGGAEVLLDKLNTKIYTLLHESHIILPEAFDFNWLDEEAQSYPE